MLLKPTQTNSTLYCFNPLVTLLSGTIEFAFALFSCFRYSKTAFGRLGIFLLLLLSVFQFSEYAICSGSTLPIWNRIGFAATTFLPALALQMTGIITKRTFLTPIAYVSATLIAFNILSLQNAFTATYCTGTFVLFELNDTLHYFLLVYYIFFVFAAMIKLIKFLHQETNGTDVALWTLLGYLSFIIPSIAVIIVSISSRAGIPSIMCGFAVLLAFVLLFKVLPLYEASIKKSASLESR